MGIQASGDFVSPGSLLVIASIVKGLALIGLPRHTRFFTTPHRVNGQVGKDFCPLFVPRRQLRQ